MELPQTGPVFHYVDLDGDYIEELVSAYTFQGNTYLLVLKQINFQWQPLVHLQIDEHTISDLHVMKLKHKKALVIEWKTKHLPSYLDYLEWTNNGFKRLPVEFPQIVITKNYGDVTGDGNIDTVYLTGTKQPDSPYWKNITLVVFRHVSNSFKIIHLKEDSGYNPTIFLGDFTGNHVKDILVIIDTGGSGATINTYIYSYLNEKPRQIFDSEFYYQQTKYAVNYEDLYKVRVTSSLPKKQYLLDIQYKGKEYLSEIYNPNGTLTAPIEGWVDPLGGLYAVDFNRDGTYELLAFQKIAGRYHADGLGYVENLLQWNGKKFTTIRQNIAVEGKEL